MYPIKLLLVATLECDAIFIPLSLRWRRHFNFSDQCKGECSLLQRPGELAIVASRQKGRVPMRSTGSVEQPMSYSPA